MTTFEVVPYGGWDTCYRAANDTVELIVTGEVGPRIIHFALLGQHNEFQTQLLGQTGGDEWRNYGGHRLWHAPEIKPRTYQPDNVPVVFEQHADFGRFTQPLEIATGIQKSIDVSVAATGERVTITHRLSNHGLWPVTLSVWGLSVMAPGGVGILPLPPRKAHPDALLPANTLTLWAYTDMSDPRWTWGGKYVLLRQQSVDQIGPQKIGASIPDGWLAYARDNHVFIKRFGYQQNVAYPDLNSSGELFTNARMLEVESLGPLREILPGESVESVEHWSLYDNIPTPQNDDDVDAHILPLVLA